MKYVKTLLLYFFVFVAVQLVIGFAVQTLATLFPEITSVMPSYKAAVILYSSGISSIILLVLFFTMRWYREDRTFVRSRPWSVLCWSFLLGIGILLPLTRLEECIPQEWLTNLIQDEMNAILHTRYGYFVICILAPLMEEVIFRGAVINACKTFSRNNAPSFVNATLLPLVISALMFSLVHMNPAQMPHAFIVGLILGWVYLRTNSIIPCFIIHWLNNSSAYVLVNIFPHIPTDAKLAAYFNGSEAAVAQAVVFSLMIAIPSLYQITILTKRK